MSAFHDAMGTMARAAADTLLEGLGAGFGSGTLVMTMDPTQSAGTASELGYITAYPVTLTFELVHGRVLGILTEKKWELIISASEMESGAEDGGYPDVVTMMQQCRKLAWAGKKMTVESTEPELIGGSAYFYRIHGKEIA